MTTPALLQSVEPWLGPWIATSDPQHAQQLAFKLGKTVQAKTNKEYAEVWSHYSIK
jgi:hypothetical protein